MLGFFGIDRIKLTGGEPLLRSDIVEIIGRIKRAGADEVSISTNGTHLAKMAPLLKERGLDRVNVSLHSLRQERFKQITGKDGLLGVIAGIRGSIEAGLLPIKINTTLLEGVNVDEIDDLIEFSHSLGGGKTNVLQFIELVMTKRNYYKRYHYPLETVKEYLEKRAAAVTERISHRRPKYELPNGVTVEFVRPMHNSEFCMGCNRIRITYDGRFKPCLMRRDNHIDFLNAMRSGADDSEIIKLFRRAISLREPFFRPDTPRQARLLTSKARSPA
jgi:cyclic pyranopterin phosphate synthase